MLDLVININNVSPHFLGAYGKVLCSGLQTLDCDASN
jgi:hypothetical protein